LQFFGANSFNRSIGRWDVRSVTDMTGMVRLLLLMKLYNHATAM
jgi:hypothetical protein